MKTKDPIANQKQEKKSNAQCSAPSALTSMDVYVIGR